MATRSHVRHVVEGKSNIAVCVVEWSGLLAGDVGESLVVLPLADITVQVLGVPGGSTILFEGSCEYPVVTTRVQIRDGFTALAISFAASPGMAQIGDVPTSLRPRVVGGDGTTNWAAWLCAKGDL